MVPPARNAVELVTVHDLTSVHHPEYCDENTVHYPHLVRRALGRGAHVHTVSAFVADEVIEVFGVERERIHVVHNGVSDAADGDSVAGRLLAGGDRYVLAIGTIEPRKNFAALVRAFDRDRASRPRRPARDRRQARVEHVELRRRASDAKARDRVVLTGRVNDRQRADLLAGATLLAYPSLYEGFGLPPLEAMQAGTPVVATTVGAVPEVLGDAAQLVAPTDDALADGLTTVLEDEALQRNLVVAGTDRVARYSWDRCADELTDIYRKISNRA